MRTNCTNYCDKLNEVAYLTMKAFIMSMQHAVVNKILKNEYFGYPEIK